MLKRTSVSSNKKSKNGHFNAISTNVFAYPYCWYVHTVADRCQSCVLTARGAATAKCTQLAFVTFNYGSSTFHETVIEPGALTLFETTGALQFTLCESSISADFHQQKPPCGTRWGYHKDGVSYGWADNAPPTHYPMASHPPSSPIRHKIIDYRSLCRKLGSIGKRA